MENNEKVVFVLKIITMILCAILLMQVILFAGITAFASVENYFIPSEARLNYRLNSSMNIVSYENNYSFVTNTIEVPIDATNIYIKSPNQINIGGNNTKYVLTDVAIGGSGTIFYMATADKEYLGDDIYRFNISAYADGTVVSKYTYIIFNIQFESSTGLQNVTLQDVQDIQINFTGDFTEDITEDITIMTYLDGWFDFLPSVALNLTSMIYNNGSFTIIGYGLFFIVGLGIIFGIISLILKSLRGGK